MGLDRISDLPEGIIIIILSFSTVRDAVRICMVSKRWRNLWKFVDNLNFNAENKLGRFRDCRNQINLGRPKFAQWVDYVMHLYQGPSLSRLSIHYDLDYSFSSHIDRWISFAVSKNVIYLKLDFSHVGYKHYGPFHFFPSFHVKNVVTSVLHLSLTASRLNPCSLDNFRSLRTLSLTNGYLTDKILENFLSKCSCLENLSVHHSRNLVNPKFVGSSLVLKCLEICQCDSLKSIEIYAKDLKSLKYFGQKIDFRLINTPQFVDLSLGVTCKDHVVYALGQFASNFFRLETLVLQVLPDEVQLTAFPTSYNLRVLVLLVVDTTETFLTFSSILKASPFLLRFELNACYRSKLKPRETKSSSLGYPLKCLKEIEPREIQNIGLESLHKCLKEVEFRCFRGYDKDIELLIYLLENSTALEKITLDTHDRLSDGRRSRSCFSGRHQLQTAKERARQFRNTVNSSVNVVII